MSATLLCMRPPNAHGAASADVWTQWPSPEAGAAALKECTPRCGPKCSGVHVLAWSDGWETHVVGPPRQEPPLLAVELAALYPKTLQQLDDDDCPPSTWPAPADLNEDLDRPANPSPIADRQAHAALLRATAVMPQDGPPSSTLPDDQAAGGVVGTGREPLPPMPIPLPSNIRRFWSKVDKTETCWLWTGAKNTNGYGNFYADGATLRAHRFAWRVANGPVPAGVELGHLSGCPRHCVRPDHVRIRPRPPMRQCEVAKCLRPHMAKGCCQHHYDQRKKPCHSPNAPLRPASMPTPASIPAATGSPLP